MYINIIKLLVIILKFDIINIYNKIIFDIFRERISDVMNFEEMLFLKESYNETLENYNLILEKKKSFGWDWVIITASNDTQAKSYESQINYRKEQGMLPEVRIDVIPDEGNKRIGSGGATLNVLKFLNENDKFWNDKKILIIHSGGDSKRIPQYSACGKLFSHVPRSLIDNKPSTLFDEFMVTLSLVPDRLKPGILVVSGDVLLLFNYLQLDVLSENALAISMKEKVNIGQNHGVFLTDKSGNLIEFLHKNSEKELIKKGACDDHNMVDIDTGLIWLDSNITKDLLSLIMSDNQVDDDKKVKYINDINRLSFYGDLLYPLSANGNLEDYLNSSAEGINDSNLEECRRNIWKLLKKYSMKVIKTFPSKFIHVGTTNELRELNISASKNYSFLNWKNNILTNINFENCSVINSLIKENVIIKEGSFIEDSILENANIGKNSILTGTKFSGNLPDDTVLHVLPIVIKDTIYYVARVYGVYDNPKDVNRYMNKDFNEFIKENNLSKEMIWDDVNNLTLWDANIYELCKTEDEALNAYERLIRMCSGVATANDIQIWKNADKISLAKSFMLANMDLITFKQDEIDNLIRANLILNDFKSGCNVIDCCKYINKKNVVKIVELLSKNRDEKNYRLDFLLSYITDKYSELFPMKSDYFVNECYKKIGNALDVVTNNYQINEPKEEVVIKKPVRINFGGGWSDTPPYCFENGGTVLNASVFLNDQMPIEVKISKYKKGKYKFASIDLNAQVEYDNKNDLNHFNKVGDPFILSKASLYSLNIFESEFLEKYGIEITTNVNVPAGSGLGTSSILIGAIIIALAKFYRIKLSNQDIFNLILKTEQNISTGGGWQDQIGGILPGIKLISTNFGFQQKYDIQNIEFNNITKELENRMVLIYTGQRRIAKNLLRKMMNKYMKNDKIAKDILKKIQYYALSMKLELEKGSVDSFANLLTEHFNMIKEIDKGVTNVCIDHIISSINNLISGYTIAGAGGGGFLFVVLRNGVDKKHLEERINLIYRDNGIKVYNCSFVKDSDCF